MPQNTQNGCVIAAPFAVCGINGGMALAHFEKEAAGRREGRRASNLAAQGSRFESVDKRVGA